MSINNTIPTSSPYMSYGIQQPAFNGYVPGPPDNRSWYPSYGIPNQCGPSSSNYSVNQIPNVWQPQQTKLYKLEPPTFDGDPIKWQNCWGRFQSAVHNHNMPNVQKFTYLIQSLKGVAYNAVAGIALTNDNYFQALQILFNQFGNPEVIKDKLYSQLRHLSISGLNVRDLRNSINEFDRILRQLQTLNEDIEHPFVVHQLLTKIPRQVLVEIERMKPPQERWSVSYLKQALWNLITIQERIERVTEKESSKQTDDTSDADYDESFQQNLPTTMMAATIVKQESNRKGTQKPCMTCVFCGGQHYNDQCKKFKNLETRIKRLKELKRCFNCFKNGHLAHQCTMVIRPCFHCKKMHNRALCMQMNKDRGRQRPTVASNSLTMDDNVTVQEEVSQGDSSPGEPNVHIRTTSFNSLQGVTDKATMLSTARVMMKNPKQLGSMKKVHVLFDSGSQRSFVTKQLIQELQITEEMFEALSVVLFTNKKQKYTESARVEIEMMCNDGTSKIIDVNVLPELTGAVQLQSITLEDGKFMETIPEEEFADKLPYKGRPIKPDVLIGQDYMWDIIDGPKQKLPSGLYMIPSQVGILFAGMTSNQEDRTTEVRTQNNMISINQRASNTTAEQVKKPVKDGFGPRDNNKSTCPYENHFGRFHYDWIYDPVEEKAPFKTDKGCQVSNSETPKQSLSQVRQVKTQQVLPKCLLSRGHSGISSIPAVAFQNTGLNILKPIPVKVNGVFFQRTKVWICVFTCLQTRTIHLEPLLNFSFTSFLDCIRHFIAVKRKPRTIKSQIPPHFEDKKGEVSEAYHNICVDDNVVKYLKAIDISWETTVAPLQPWDNDMYEKMVNLLRMSISTALDSKLLTYDQLMTFLAEISKLVNYRPLAAYYDGLQLKELKCPTNFLFSDDCTYHENPDSIQTAEELTGPKIAMENSDENLVKYWNSAEFYQNNFWNIWQQAYLIVLQNRLQAPHKSDCARASSVANNVFHVNDVVIISEEFTHRGEWKIGKIINLSTVNTANIQCAKVILPNTKTIVLPTYKLYQLELGNVHKQDSVSYTTTNGCPKTGIKQKAQPTETTKDETRITQANTYKMA